MVMNLLPEFECVKLEPIQVNGATTNSRGVHVHARRAHFRQNADTHRKAENGSKRACPTGKQGKTRLKRHKNSQFKGLMAPLLHYGNNRAQSFRLRQN